MIQIRIVKFQGILKVFSNSIWSTGNAVERREGWFLTIPQGRVGFSARSSAVFFLINSDVSPLHQVLDLSVRRDASGQNPHRLASAPAPCTCVPFQAHSVGIGGDVAQEQRRTLLKPLPRGVCGRHGEGQTRSRKSTRVLSTVCGANTSLNTYTNLILY